MSLFVVDVDSAEKSEAEGPSFAVEDDVDRDVDRDVTLDDRRSFSKAFMCLEILDRRG